MCKIIAKFIVIFYKLFAITLLWVGCNMFLEFIYKKMQGERFRFIEFFYILGGVIIIISIIYAFIFG